jgi:hypothetical protein
MGWRAWLSGGLLGCAAETITPGFTGRDVVVGSLVYAGVLLAISAIRHAPKAPAKKRERA